MAFQFQPTDSATCDEFTVQLALWKLLVALVRRARVDDAAIKAKTGGKSAQLSHVLTPTRSPIAIIIIFNSSMLFARRARLIARAPFGFAFRSSVGAQYKGTLYCMSILHYCLVGYGIEIEIYQQRRRRSWRRRPDVIVHHLFSMHGRSPRSL